MEQMGASPEDTLFVGDSDVDIRTARNGGLTSCGVLWGFRSRQELEALREQVSSGTYQVDAKEIAARMLLMEEH